MVLRTVLHPKLIPRTPPHPPLVAEARLARVRMAVCYNHIIGQVIAIGGRTDVTHRLTTPVTIGGALSRPAETTTLHLAVDDPDDFAGALQARSPQTA
jgi:hypothetical protein